MYLKSLGYLIWKLLFFSPLNSRNHNVKFLNAVIFVLFGFKFLSVSSVQVYMVKDIIDIFQKNIDEYRYEKMFDISITNYIFLNFSFYYLSQIWGGEGLLGL